MGAGTFLIVFYSNREGIGDHEKAVCALEFDSWEKLQNFVFCQTVPVQKLNPLIGGKIRGH